MGPKKKNKPQPFFLFMQDVKKEKERQGMTFPNGNADVIPIADELWKVMTPEEKQYYSNLAAQRKGEDSKDLCNKFTSLGISYAEIENERIRVQEALNLMLATIENTVSNLDFDSGFKEFKFYLCHVNFYYKNDSNVYKAAEIALSEFNLKSGLLNTFHRFVDSGKIEKGFRHMAKTQIEETHQIPIEDDSWTRGERDYCRLLQDIKQFLSKNSKARLPPIYTMPDNPNQNTSMSAVKSTLSTLCEAADEDFAQFRIYELPYLYHELRKKAVSESGFQGDKMQAAYLTVAMATNDIEKDLFSYCRNLACNYHEEKDIQIFCSLSVVTRWVFTICDFILQYIPDNVIPGKHVPINSNTAKLSARMISPLPNECRPVAPKMKVHDDIVVQEPVFVPAKIEESVEFNPRFSAPSAWSNGIRPSFGNSFSQPTYQASTTPAPRTSGIRLGSSGLPMTQPNYSDEATNVPGPSGLQSSSSSSSAPASSSWQTVWGRGRGMPTTNNSTPINWALSAGRGSNLRFPNN